MNKVPYTELLRLLHVVVNFIAARDIILQTNIKICGSTMYINIDDKNQKSTLKIFSLEYIFRQVIFSDTYKHRNIFSNQIF